MRSAVVTKEATQDSVAAWSRIAEQYRECGQHANALRACLTGLETHPGELPLLDLLTNLHWDAGELANALNAAEDLLSADPSNAWGWFRLGLLLQRLKHFSAAIRSFRKAVALAPNVSLAYQQIGRTWALQGRYARAVVWTRKALALDKDSAHMWNQLAYCCALCEMSEDAIDAGRRAVAMDANAHTWHSLGSGYMAAGRTRHAIHCFLNAVTDDWNHAQSWHDLGVAYVRSGDHPKAVAALARLRQLDLAWSASLADTMAMTTQSLPQS